MNTSEFWSIAGSAGEGVRFTDASSQINFVSAKSVVEKFRSDNYEPEGYTLEFLCRGAGVGGRRRDRRIDRRRAKVGATLHSRTIPTVIGDL